MTLKTVHEHKILKLLRVLRKFDYPSYTKILLSQCSSLVKKIYDISSLSDEGI